MFHDLMVWLDRHRIIYDRVDEEPYLQRYYILFKDRSTAPFNIFIHRFLKSDPDELHDHPWAYMTFILWGGYWEYTPLGKKWYGMGSFRHAPANSLHRIELDPTYPYCWTLFIPFSKQRDWGFMTSSGWVRHDEYLMNKKTT
jgi:hypothetical protein